MTFILECIKLEGSFIEAYSAIKIYAGTSLNTMKEWYSENGLKMNSNKAQRILFATPNFNKRIETYQITIDDIYSTAYGR